MAKASKAKEEKQPVVDPKMANDAAADDTLAAEGTGEVVIDDAAAQEEAAADLQKQLADLKKSEEIQRTRADNAERERQAALTRAAEREKEVVKFQKEAVQSQSDAILSSLAAASAEAEKAQQDIELAIANGDAKLQADAYRRLARAEGNISRLEDGKAEIEAKAKAEKEAPVQTQQTDPLERTNLPEGAKNWLRSHPDYLTDNRKNAKIQSLHWDVIDEGHAAFSPAYFESLEQHLGMRDAPIPAQQQQQPAQRNIVSAPVSREVPNSNPNRQGGKVTLTAAQKEAAKISGISEVDYAKNLLKLEQAKANGQYTGGQ